MLKQMYVKGVLVGVLDSEHAGERFGELTVFGRTDLVKNKRRFYLAQCTCGAWVTAPLSGLRRGDNTSCGCKRGLNNTKRLKRGARFHHLTVMNKVGRPDTTNKTGHYYKFSCDCGNKKILPRYEVVKGLRKSCGCSSRSN